MGEKTTLTTEELAGIEKRRGIEEVVEKLIEGARINRPEEVKETDLFKVPDSLREALVNHLWTFDYASLPTDSPEAMTAKQIALNIARVEEVLELEDESFILGSSIDGHIMSINALIEILDFQSGSIGPAAVALVLVLGALYHKASADIADTLEDYVVIPKNKAKEVNS